MSRLTWPRFLRLEAERFIYACAAQWHRSRLYRIKGFPLNDKQKHHMRKILQWNAKKNAVGFLKEPKP